LRGAADADRAEPRLAATRRRAAADQPRDASVCCRIGVNYSLRTERASFFDDARRPQPFAADLYFKSARARLFSACLVTRAKLTGVLYLENTLTSRVFAPAAAR